MKVDLSSRSVEQMGLFGLTWPERVASFMKKRLKGTAIGKKLKSFWGGGGMNTRLINNIHREYMAYMATGRPPANFSVQPSSSGSGGEFDINTNFLVQLLTAKLNINPAIVIEFLRALFVLARDGKIPYAKWNPKGYKVSTALRRTFKSEKGIMDKVQKTGSYLKIGMVLASLGLGAYVLQQVKPIRKVIKR